MWQLDEVNNGIRRREFSVTLSDGAEIPGVLWTPAGRPSALPLILSAHGATHHKTHPVMLLIRDRLMAGTMTAVATIDFDGHGDRGDITSLQDEALLDLAEDTKKPASTAAEMSSVLSHLLDTDEFDRSAVAYFGLSLGAWYGIPFLANEERVCAAVLGLTGAGMDFLERSGRPPMTLPIWERAREIETPVFFLAQADDEIANLDSTVRLFKLLGSRHKRFVVAPGAHALVPDDVLDAGVAFLRDRLSGKPKPRPFLAPIFADQGP